MDFIVEEAIKTADSQQPQVTVGQANIKVIGVGGAGNNMVGWLYNKGIKGAEILAVNTDQQHLEITDADAKFLIGTEVTRGLGCGGYPQKGAEAAQESMQEIKESLNMGNEGIMIKALDAPYKPGSRVGYGVKVKPIMETLDLVIVGAEWGEGKRSKWLSSFVIACISNGKYLEIGKVGTGIKEKEEEGVTFNQLTKLLKPHILSEQARGVTVKPTLVIEVNYEEIQKSPTYSSGFALRFPRFVCIREDRNPQDIAKLSMIKDYYDNQRQRNIS